MSKKKVKRFSQDRMYQENYEEMVRRYGANRAGNANIGWYQEDYSLSSKVYARPNKDETRMILTTTWNKDTKRFEHTEEEY